jgi:trimeric autotransporter adhesin
MKKFLRIKYRISFFVLTFLLSVVIPQIVFAQPANDNCGGSVLITPTTAATGCTNFISQFTGTTVAATQSLAGCSGTADDDVWYRFVANGGSHTVTVTPPGGGGSLNNPVFEVFSSSDNTCSGTFTSIVCQNASSGANTAETATLNNLINGNTYYVRIHSNANGSGQGQFTICITKVNTPVNDNCVTSVLLTPNSTCTTTAPASQATGTLVGATNSLLAATPCAGIADDDVWYSFVAQYNTQTVTISGIGSAIARDNSGIGGPVRAQIFSGTCLGLTSIQCTQGNYGTGNLVLYPNSLTVGNTYYIRVYSNNNISLSASGGFTICVQNPATTAPVVFFGKSFQNITKNATGGTVETGNVLEIRASVVLRPTSILDSCAFLDNIPAGTTYVPGSLAILTNEGKVYKSFTDAAGDDEGGISGSAITINMGFNPGDNPATAFRKGRIRNSHRPVVGGGSSIMLASYRVTVTQTVGNIISLGGGTFTYANFSSPATVITNTFNSNNVIVYQDFGLCSNATGLNILDNTIAGDFDGTFGSGNFKNRIASPNMPPGYTYTTMNGGDPGDFFYSIPNNTSRNSTTATYSTVNTWPKPEADPDGAGPLDYHRVFGVFDIIGDHTGAADPIAGNPAADTTGGATGGYMLLVNASYNIDTAFKYNISNLCPSTYYEISCWVRNICKRCGGDSTGAGASGVSVPVGYIPTALNDSSGVYPNLSFSVDNVNHYTTGNMTYRGFSGEWVKRGFTFVTGPSQTNIQLAITNNAPGGGGNDWALDDIRVSNCLPNMSYSPSVVPDWCINNPVFITDTVRSVYPNYVYYKWQRSVNGIGPWTTITGDIGPVGTTFNGSIYQYVATYTVPWFWTGAANALDKYRLVVSTTAANLSEPNCSSTDVVNTVTINYIACLWPLNVTLLSFNGKLTDDKANLSWTTSKEEASFHFDVQKSADGINYTTIGTINSYSNNVSETNQYSFIDPVKVDGKAHYRIVMVSNDNKRKISRVIQLNRDAKDFNFGTVINPFSSELQFEVFVPKNASIEAELIDQNGKTVKKKSFYLSAGTNSLSIPDADILSKGIYTLRLHNSNGSIITKRVMKK